jgi:hypothetical protein
MDQPNGCEWCGKPVPAGKRHCSTEHEQYDRQSETTWRRAA